MNRTIKLLLLSSSCLAVLISVSNAYSQSDNQKELYDECVNVAGKSLCDFLFKKSTQKIDNVSVNSSEISALNSSDTALKSANITHGSNDSSLAYNDNDLGFSMRYPSDWTTDNQNSQFNTVVGFVSPDNNARVDIRVFPEGKYKSIKDYGNDFKKSDEVTLLAYYRNSTTLLAGKPAFKAIYLTTYNPSLFENAFGYKSSTSKAMFTATMVPEKKSIYAVAYFAISADFDDNLPVIEKMIDSFQTYGKGPIIQEDNSSSSVP